jgi:hypothetical protein
MPFEARLYIQGVGIYVPHDKRPEMLVLFPSQEQAHKRGLRDLHGNPICRHHAVVQFNARCLGNLPNLPSGLPDPWTTLDVSGLWLGFQADGKDVPPFRMAGNNGVPGVPYLPDIVKNFKIPVDPSLDQRAWPDASSVAEILKAGLFLDAGVLSSYAEYEGLFRFGGQAGRDWIGDGKADRKYSSVLKLELGQVDSFMLRFRTFASPDVVELPLHSPWNELEVWVRHFCDLSQPDPDRELPEAGEADIDFALNYALLEQLGELLKLNYEEIPVPRVSTSWVHGGPIGLEPRKCNGVGTKKKSFSSPFRTS